MECFLPRDCFAGVGRWKVSAAPASRLHGHRGAGAEIKPSARPVWHPSQTSLSYVGSALVGEGKMLYKGEVGGSAEVLGELGLEPMVLEAKEGLGDTGDALVLRVED